MRGRAKRGAEATDPDILRLSTNALLVVLTFSFAATIAYAQVTFERLVNSGREPQNWLTYSGDYSGRRFSPLDQINPTNARAMVAKWVYQTAATGKLEPTPLVVDGILYATGGMIAPSLSMPAPVTHLDVSASTSRRHSSVLRPRESGPGNLGRQSFPRDARRPRDRARCEDGQCSVGCSLAAEYQKVTALRSRRSR